MYFYINHLFNEKKKPETNSIKTLMLQTIPIAKNQTNLETEPNFNHSKS